MLRATLRHDVSFMTCGFPGGKDFIRLHLRSKTSLWVTEVPLSIKREKSVPAELSSRALWPHLPSAIPFCDHPLPVPLPNLRVSHLQDLCSRWAPDFSDISRQWGLQAVLISALPLPPLFFLLLLPHPWTVPYCNFQAALELGISLPCPSECRITYICRYVCISSCLKPNRLQELSPSGLCL